MNHDIAFSETNIIGDTNDRAATDDLTGGSAVVHFGDSEEKAFRFLFASWWLGLGVCGWVDNATYILISDSILRKVLPIYTQTGQMLQFHRIKVILIPLAGKTLGISCLLRQLLAGPRRDLLVVLTFSPYS